MKIDSDRLRSPRIPATTLAGLALLVALLLAASAIFSAERGVGMRFADETDGGLPSADASTVWLKVLADGSLRVGGLAVPGPALVDAVASRVDGRASATVVLYADPSAEFGSVLAAYDALAAARHDGRLGGIRLALPTRRQVERYAVVEGRDPFGGQP